MLGRVRAALALRYAAGRRPVDAPGVSVCSPRIQQSSSACLAMFGSSCENHVPVWPYCLNSNFEGVMTPPPGPDLPPLASNSGL